MRALDVPLLGLSMLALSVSGCRQSEGKPAGKSARRSARPSAGRKSASAGKRWVKLPGGTFQMGDSFLMVTPVHAVKVPAFRMARTETTVAQYKACVSAGKCTPPGKGQYCNWGVAKRDDHPINCVDWNQAAAFCRWAGGRLPSESEWEWAARGGGDRTYPWGNDKPSCGVAVMRDGGPGCGERRTWPVCSKPGGNSAHGLCDLAGNVYEWVQDTYHMDYKGAPDDGTAWVGGDGKMRVFRGGCWSSTERRLRAARRMFKDSSHRDGLMGFRCARRR